MIERVRKAQDQATIRDVLLQKAMEQVRAMLDRNPDQTRVKVFLDFERKEWDITASENGRLHHG